ncbi:hypothetical protein [Nonomuraea sp. SYSU D8015]|uniref:hypothetical protein n=1 Tax=Nonomuraea sp. SYSU D8015 TaxID=2593644 RepID=UPI001CB6F8BC|nr:hypothetical protein [Nonomuraea sp. SYSU D8015]
MIRCLVALMFLAGCAAAPAADGVASAGEPASAATPSPPAGGDVLKFAQCLRDQGLKVDDPAPGERVDVDDADRAGRELMEKAMTACRSLAPPQTADRDDDRQAVDAMVAYARCMREQGLDWPDPVVVNGDARWPDTDDLPGRNTDRFKTADDECRPLLGEKKTSGGTK